MNYKVAGIGELLWDLLPGGRQLGGAPANFAYHASALGAEARLISRVGNDDLGREAKDRLAMLGLPLDHIQVDRSLPTGTVSVSISADGQPQYQIHENVAWDGLAAEPSARAAVSEADAVCFGTLAQRSEPARSTIRSLLAASPVKALRVLDVNLRQHYFSAQLIAESLSLANVLKLNDTELPRLAEMFALTGDIRAQLSDLASRYNLSLIAYTRGPYGSLLLSKGNWSDHPGEKTKVADTVGAGDAFTAAMILGLLAGWELDEINHRANQIAAYVCSQPGATAELPTNLRIGFQKIRQN